jgi:hypothetical protein
LVPEKYQFITDMEVVMDMLSDEAWRTFEDVLLVVSSRSGEVIEVVMPLSPAGLDAWRTPDYTTSLPRFREVGGVTFEFPSMVSGPTQLGHVSLYD